MCDMCDMCDTVLKHPRRAKFGLIQLVANGLLMLEKLNKS